MKVLGIDAAASAGIKEIELKDHYNGTTVYTQAQLRRYTATLSTDSNGRVTAILTTTGVVGGAALFTSILSLNSICLQGSGVAAVNRGFMTVESISGDLKTVIFRGLKGTTAIIAGATTTFLQTGVTVYVDVLGVAA